MSCADSRTGHYLTPPDGGWGYVIILVIALTNAVCILPITNFGIIFGPFIKSVGDEAGSTAIIIGICFAFQWGAGFITNILLQKVSYRKVGVIGAVLYFIGLAATSIVTDLYQFILAFSVVQALGFGLMLPAMLTAFNLYFHKRRTVVYNCGGILTVLLTVTFPAFGTFLMENFGFRGANLIQAAIGLNCLPAMLCLHPIKWHLKKRKMSLINPNPELNQNSTSIERKMVNSSAQFKNDGTETGLCERPERRDNETHSSVKLPFWKAGVEFLDLGLFTDPVYINITIGISLCLATDSAFVPMFPLLLTNLNVSTTDITNIMTIFYVGDIVGRLVVIGVTAYTEIKNRYLLLIGATLVSICRTAFLLHNSFWWLAICSALMGSTRCLFYSCFPLIISELYRKRFVTAFSLFMIVCGFVSLLSGFVLNVIKNVTDNDEMVAHSLTVMNLLCAVPWILELLCVRIFKK